MSDLLFTKKKRNSTKAQATRDRLLDAAAKLFREQGYFQTRLSDISDVAGIQPGSLYYHFDSRESLLEAVFKVALVRSSEYVRVRVAAVSDRRPVNVLREALRSHFKLSLEDDDYCAASLRIASENPDEISAPLRKGVRRYRLYFQDLFEQAGAAGQLRSDVDLSAIRNFVVAGLSSVTEWYHQDDGISVDELADQILSVLFEGLLAE